MDGDILTHLIDSVTGLQEAVHQLLAIAEKSTSDSISDGTRQSLQNMKIGIEQQQEALRRARIERRMAVERLDIEDPDGTTRLAISNKKHLPKIIIDGQTYDGRQGGSAAGLIFYDDEGSECGGLGYGGKREENGQYSASGSLMFDQFQQDQVIGLEHNDVNGQRIAGLQVWDRPGMRFPEWIEHILEIDKLQDSGEKERAFEGLRKQGLMGAQRVFVGKWIDGNAVCGLFDGQGCARLRLVVQENGVAHIDFLDASGAVVKSIGPDTDK